MINLKHYPIPISGLTLGMTSIAGFWYAACAYNTTGFIVMLTISLLATALLVPLLLKFLLHPSELYAALQHPTTGSVVPTLPMTVMILSHSLKPISTTAATILWLTAVISHVIFLIIFTIHRCRDADLNQMIPSWFVPPIGIVVACLSVPDNQYLLLAKILLVFGVITYLILLPIMLYRVSLGTPIDDSRKPTLAIFAAPASLTLSGYLSLTAHPNEFSVTVLFTLSLLMIISVYLMLPRLLRLPFSPAFSAFTFPLAISATAAYKMSLWAQGESSFALNSHILLVLALFEGIIASLMIIYVLQFYVKHLLNIYVFNKQYTN